MALRVIAAPSPSPLLSAKNSHKGGHYEPLLNQMEKVEAQQDVLSHQDVMHQGIKILHETGGHKLDAIDAARHMHKQGQDVHLALDQTHFEDDKHGIRHELFKYAATHVNHLKPSVDSMHRELQEHVKTLHEGGSQKAQETAAAVSLRDTLAMAKTWGLHHGEDPLDEIVRNRRKKQPSSTHYVDGLFSNLSNRSPKRIVGGIALEASLKAQKDREERKRHRVAALDKEEKEVLWALETHPKAKRPAQPPAQSFLTSAQEKLTSFIWGSSSQQHR